MKKAIVPLTIVWLILAIIGFLIIIYFIHYLYSGNFVEKEVCHNSVILRATMPKGAKSFVPLKCRTQKICISYGLFGGSCKDVFGNNKEVVVIKVKNVEDIEKVFADQMAECWSMMGEGKVSLFSNYLVEVYGFGKVYPTCVICSRIAFDKSLLNSKIFEELKTKFNLVKYLANNKISGKEITYLEYLTNGGKHVVGDEGMRELANLAHIELSNTTNGSNYEYEPQLSEETETEQEIEREDNLIKEEEINETTEFPNDIAIVFSQITTPTQLGSLKNLGKLIVGGGVVGLLIASKTTLTINTKFIKLLRNPFSWVALISFIIAQQTNVAFQRTRASVYCSSNLLSSQEGRNGCSGIKIIRYDSESIKRMCGKIESIP